MVKNPKQINFEPIPGVESGYIALTIYEPGGFINNEDYAIFVGGCGNGQVPSLAMAKRLLLQKAKERCLYYIEKAEKEARHYRMQLARLDEFGLKRTRT